MQPAVAKIAFPFMQSWLKRQVCVQLYTHLGACPTVCPNQGRWPWLPGHGFYRLPEVVMFPRQRSVSSVHSPQDDHGDSVSTATAIGATQGILDPVSDVDYCSFSAEAGRSFRIEVSLDTLLDSILTL